jgi:hypothetical protein
MPTTTNYTLNGAARKVDLYIMGAFDFSKSAVQKTSPTLAVESGGQVCTGMVKLAQKVVSDLLSCNLHYDVDWGTNMTQLIMGTSLAKVQKQFNLALSVILDNIVNQLRSAETSDMPDDEKIQTVELKRLVVTRSEGKASLSLNVVSMTQEIMPIVVPISVVP